MLFLTFDDGPDREVTPEVLKMLGKYEAKATFFCVGQNVEKYPGIIKDLKNEGHSIGNHTFSHLKGKKTSPEDYLRDVEKGKEFVKSDLFRPPYGSITKAQINKIKGQNQIIMWSTLPGDFDQNISKKRVLQRAISNSKPGDIIVFHDNQKFKDKMLYALNGYLDHFHNKDFQFAPITSKILA